MDWGKILPEAQYYSRIYKVPTDKLTRLLCMICENSEVPFLTLYSVFFVQIDVTDPFPFISVYNKSKKKIQDYFQLSPKISFSFNCVKFMFSEHEYLWIQNLCERVIRDQIWSLVCQLCCTHRSVITISSKDNGSFCRRRFSWSLV